MAELSVCLLGPPRVEWAGRALPIARQIADRTQEILCLGHLGWLSVQERQAGEAQEHLQEALAERIGSCSEQSRLHAGLAEAYRLGGDREQAETHARRALELVQACGRAYDEALARRILEELEDFGDTDFADKRG